MKLDICQRGESTQLEVPEGLISVGGGAGDGLRIEGLSPHMLDLRIEGARVTLCPRETLGVQGVLVPRGVPRLLLPGECVALSEDVEMRVIAQRPAVPPGTVAVLKQLLGGKGEPESSCAASLTCLTGLDMGRRFFVADPRTVIGRSKDAHIQLRDRAVSRSHARLRKGTTGFYLEDLGSPNGVYVNGSRLRTVRVLNEGDILELGRSLLRFTGPGPEPTPPPASPAAAVAVLPATPPEVLPIAKRPRRHQGDWALIGMGAALALAGLVVGWGFAG
jgi:hypothetical protein